MLPGLTTPLVPVAALGLFVLGGLAFSTVASRAPALNESLQVEGVTGSTRSSHLPAMYDHADYLYRTGFGFMNGPMLTLAQSLQEPDAPAREREPLEVIIGYFTEAETYLEQSLRLDPANAYAWLAYARTKTALEALDEADTALSNSWTLSPGMASPARQRVYLISSLRTIRDRPDGYAEIRDSDLAVIRRNSPELADRLASR